MKNLTRGTIATFCAFNGTRSEIDVLLVGAFGVYTRKDKRIVVIHIPSGLGIPTRGNNFKKEAHAARFAMKLHTLPGIDWTQREISVDDIAKAGGKEPNEKGQYYFAACELINEYFDATAKACKIDVTLPPTPELPTESKRRTIYDMAGDNALKREREYTNFYRTFGFQLRKPLFDNLLGLDVIKLDELLGVPDGTSTRDFIQQKYGAEGVRIIKALM